MSENNSKKKWYSSWAFRIPFIILLVLLFSFCSLVVVRGFQFKKEFAANPLSVNQKNNLDLLLKNKYSERYQIIQKLPYNLDGQKLSVGAASAILIDVANGNVIYEKNADEVIPPASMTKLFAMYVVDEEVSAGRLHYDDIIPLPPECWACNMPPHSSLMFLGEGHQVTLEELLLGLSICSGNDAAYALAYAVCGSMEAFVARMNQVAVGLGLSNTHFVESSGYSELNTTTAREMAAFAKVYINHHPDSLKRFHSVEKFTYPKARNLAPGHVLAAQDFTQGLPSHITMSITQQNTNPLLGKLPGCDGLKTGYIHESGYNLSLTAERNGVRFLSVTMKGPGNNTAEGQAGRVKDGTTLMEYGFKNFADYDIENFVQPVFLKVYGSRERAVNLVPAFEVKTETVPFITGETMAQNLEQVQVKVSVPQHLIGDVVLGYEYGQIEVLLGDYVLDRIPLVADRQIEKANVLIRAADAVYCK